MVEVVRAAAHLQALFERRQWQFCVIGGLALQRWGEPRETVDVDVTLLTGFGQEEPYVTELLRHYEPRIPDAADFALMHRVLLLKTQSGVGLDVALGGLPFEESCIERSTLFEFPGGAQIRTCSAEDLIVMKAFAARGRDWLDIEGIIVRQAVLIDWDYIVSQLTPLVELKETPETLDELEALRRRLEG